AAKAAAQGASGAFVATEYTLTLSLVAALGRRGVACFTATTRREVAEERRPDGTTERRSLFRFVRWRELPAPCVAAPVRG
ncbi:MAG: hypothetical protein HY814_08310, partial [Candidatus Riflebacteria bacterium]|nr:hypothetical protein [Candidatus Riflebacteria bacterium]